MAARISRRNFLWQTGWGVAGVSLGLGRASAEQVLQRTGAPKRVIVLGAGLAGLSAAYELTRAGHDVTILEARSRPGGRVHTLRDVFSDGLYLEEGATRIPNHHDFTLKYVAHFDLTLDPFTPPDLATVYYLQGNRIPVRAQQEVAWPVELTAQERAMGLTELRRRYLAPVLEKVGDVRAGNWPSADMNRYDTISRGELWRQLGASPGALTLISLVEGLRDDPADATSALSSLRSAVLNREQRQYFKIRGGTDLLPRAFANRLSERIRYACPAVRIEQDASGVRVVFRHAGTNHTLAGDRLVCAIPFSVLRHLEVSPAFTPEKRRAVEELPYASFSKIDIKSRTRFWAGQGLSGFAYTDLPIGQVWDLSYGVPGTHGVLQTYPTGAYSRQLVGMKEDERVAMALQHLQKVFPEIADNFEGGVSKCWDEDEWARGSFSFFRPGQMTTLGPHIARPEGRIHFAGDHTSIFGAWMQSALESGDRAAREVNMA